MPAGCSAVFSRSSGKTGVVSICMCMKGMQLIRKRTLGYSTLFLAAFSILHFLSYDLLNQPVITDVSFFLYFAARTAAGAIPYLDFLDYKTPLATFAGGFAYASGEFAGLDGLFAIRGLYLLFAALTALATGLVFFHLSNRRLAAAWVGVILYSGFNLLGLMPSIGNMPKQLALLSTLLALIAAHRRRWLLAGGLAALAGLDWQPGGALGCLAVVVAALLCESRSRAALKSGLGMAITACLPIAYFACHGALGKAFQLVFLAPMARPGAESKTLTTRFERIWRLLNSDCRGEMWLIYLAIAGLALFPVILFLLRRRDSFPLAAGLAVYHFGILGWTLHDFQSHGDLFILLGSLVFFAAVPVCSLYYFVVWVLDSRFRAWSLRGGAGPRRAFARHRLRIAIGLALVAGLIVAARPSFLSREERGGAPDGPLDFTLSDQREVARDFLKICEGHPVVCLDFQEILFLGKIEDALGFVYYDPVIHGILKKGDENMTGTLIRCLEEADPGLIIWPQRSRRAWISGGRMQRWRNQRYRPLRLGSDNEEYGMMVWCKVGLDLHGGR